MSSKPKRKWHNAKPCHNCPFKKNMRYLRAERVDEIEASLKDGGVFHCHKTVDITSEDSKVTPDSQHCAGALILLEKLGTPSQAMLFGRMIGVYDPYLLDKNNPDVVDSFEEMKDN